MKTLMKCVVLIAACAWLGGCGSAEKRTKWTDKNMRIMIDPDSLEPSDYVSVQAALMREGNFTVVDRAQGYRAVKTEQERSLRREGDRYADKEKWAHWGKLYGVGAIAVGHSQCWRHKPLFSLSPFVIRCKEFLSLVDANTGEVITAVDGQDDKSGAVESSVAAAASDWTDVVKKLVDAYPKDFKPQYYSEGVEHYRDLSEEEAKRQREISSESGK